MSPGAGGGQHFWGRRAVLPRDRHTHAQSRRLEAVMPMVELERLHRCTNLFDALARRLWIGSGEDEHEFTIRIAASHVALAKMLTHDTPDLAQQRFVDRLVAIDGEDRDAERRLGPRGAM